MIIQQKNVEVEGDVSLSNGTQFDAVKTVASIKFSVNERASCHLYIVPSSYFNAEAGMLKSIDYELFLYFSKNITVCIIRFI
jgi:hypothetical protein